MTTPKISRYFSRSNFNDDRLIDRTHFIVDCMDRNPLFPGAAPSLQYLIDKREAFHIKRMIAQEGTLQEKAEKNNARLEVISALENLEQYLQKLSNGNEEIILRSGLFGQQRGLAPLIFKDIKLF